MKYIVYKYSVCQYILLEIITKDARNMPLAHSRIVWKLNMILMKTEVIKMTIKTATHLPGKRCWHSRACRIFQVHR